MSSLQVNYKLYPELSQHGFVGLLISLKIHVSLKTSEHHTTFQCFIHHNIITIKLHFNSKEATIGWHNSHICFLAYVSTFAHHEFDHNYIYLDYNCIFFLYN